MNIPNISTYKTKFKNRLGAPESIHLRGSHLTYEPIWCMGLGFRGGSIAILTPAHLVFRTLLYICIKSGPACTFISSLFLSAEELKRDAELRKEAVEKMGMLRTKAMRERDEQRELRKYRFTAVRTRFLNGIILQGAKSVCQCVSMLPRVCVRARVFCPRRNTFRRGL